MRLALISDLHGNEVALDAVLAEVRSQGVDDLVCLGDVATLGPRASAVLAKLNDLGCPCILGNHDEFMLDAGMIQRYTEAAIITSSVQATREALTSDELEFIRKFQRTLDLGDAFFYHGTPRSNMEDLLSTTPPEALEQMLEGRAALLFGGGHTHIQMLRQHRGRLIVNPGSLGLPFREYVAGAAPTILLHAEYAIVTIDSGRVSVDLRRIALDRAALRAQLDGWDNPLATPLRAIYG